MEPFLFCFLGTKISTQIISAEFKFTSVRDKSLSKSVPLSPQGSLWEKGAMEVSPSGEYRLWRGGVLRSEIND